MKRLARTLSGLAAGMAVAWSAWSCGASATVPKTLSVAGSWSGTESDRLGPALLTWTLTQTGETVSGTAIMRPVDATDGSCASCHKSKDGAITGTVSGTTLTFAMYFAAGNSADPTPACSITINSSAPNVTQSTIAGTYEGSDPCEGTFQGELVMTRRPEALASRAH
jgi:hypothetical protein